MFGGGRVSFNHTSLTGFVPNADPSVMEFSGGIQLTSSTNTLFDFSGFATGGLFQMDYHAPGKDFNSLLSSPGTTRINNGAFSSWTMTAAPAPPSLTLVGTGLLCLAGYAWRRRKAVASP